MLSEIDVIKSYFERKSITISTYWVECFLEWFKDNNAQYTETSMCNDAFAQWLESDLREIEQASLPQHINKSKKQIVNNNYAVQVMYVKDISRSAYSQLKQIRDLYKLTRGEVEVETLTSGEGKRCLYLNITDGVQYINACEYHYVNVLHVDMKPGTKLLLIGPLLIRNGEILLKENNVRILGGYVEDLLIVNSYENVLARELNMPENPTSKHVQQQQTQQNETFNNVNIDDDDDIFNNIEIPENTTVNNINNEDVFQDSLDLNLDELDEISNMNEEPPINDEIEPFVYIKYLLDNPDKILNKTYKVKAEFFRVVEKLNVSKSRGWTMKFEIMDNTATMIVDFLSTVIEKLMGLSPQEAIAENQKVKNKISDSHETVSEALKKCKTKLDSYQYIMHLQFTQHVDRATIIDLETLTNEHFIQMKNRVQNTQIQIN